MACLEGALRIAQSSLQLTFFETLSSRDGKRLLGLEKGRTGLVGANCGGEADEA